MTREQRLEEALRELLRVERDNFPSVCAHRSRDVQEQYAAAIKQGREALKGASSPALPDVHRARDWQPIDTAPTDDRLILIHWGSLPVVGFRSSPTEWRVAALSRDCSYGIHGNYAPFRPTYWQPIFNPPAGKGEAVDSLSSSKATPS